ncbi:aminoglycoside phosphotransferase family protein [Marinicella rhabdoformis]|uniref:aminoglycoside phosphotransferase family protein n=1 Tax=Marinicella rhabdoformis TaxID=2580566 RepID=UPI001C554683|nr:phosphotransferase [Marinicella rhabdoformis]
MNRQQQMQQWLSEQLTTINPSAGAGFKVESASEDASFRSYHRVTQGNKTWVLMDAPPSHEDCAPFIEIQKLLFENEVCVPEIIAQDLSLGFLLLSDLGSTLLLGELNDNNADDLYGKACDQIHLMQSITSNASNLPAYDEALLTTEMNLFNEWFIDRHLGVTLTDNEQATVSAVQQLLIDNALSQPQTFVHRDFHSRNLMPQVSGQMAVIDFQDAVYGPLTYDLVSLYKDCYIAWPEDQVYQWVDSFRHEYNQKHQSNHDQATFLKWFDLMGAQRHMKAIGIFCRLNYRDGKKHYLYDIPRTMKHLQITCLAYPELADFNRLLDKIQPRFQIA